MTHGTPTWIWSVVVDDGLYVRAYNGQNSRWYQAAMRQRAGRISAAGETREVAFEPVDGANNDLVDDAYRTKYQGSAYLRSMIGKRARSATVKVTPCKPKRGLAMTNFDPTRRELLKRTAVTGSALAASPFLPEAVPSAAAPAAKATAPHGANTVKVVLHVNGAEHRLTLDPRTTLLDALREQLQLTGTKKGCGLGQCGACTVLMDGKRMKSCLSLAALVDGRGITTIEGLAKGGQLHPLQAAFIERDGFQCGYCTSGQIMGGVACIAEGHAGSAQEIRDWMSGNLCRCGAYDTCGGDPGRRAERLSHASIHS